MSASVPPPAAFDEPTARVGSRFIGTLALSNLGLWLALFAPIQVLLAQQMEAIAPTHKEAALGWVTAAGALASLLVGPVFGAWSDRTASRFGRRHPWNLGGVLIGAIALVMLGRQDTVVGVGLWWCVAQIALNGLLTALTAAVPDHVPVTQRAVCSAWVGVTQPLGVVVGTLLITLAGAGIAMGYVIVAGALIACAAPFLALVRDVRLPRSPRSAWRLRSFLSGFWISPRAYPDFAWAWITRFLINLGNAVATLYLLYFLRDAIGYERRFPGETSEDGLLLVVLIYTAGILLSAFAGGVLSDRSGRRRIHVIVSSLLMAAATALLAVWPVWPVLVVSALILGLGYGIYVAVDQALVTQVLPQAVDRGKDLGLINIANSAPQVLAPAIAAVLVTHLGGYGVLYAATTAITLLGGALVTRIRGVP